MTLAQTDIQKIARVKAVISEIENEIAGRFYGLENVKADGTPRKWSLSTRAPNAAIDAIKGTGAATPSHLIKRWCNIRRAWRSVDLTTVNRVAWTDREGVKKEVYFT